MRATTTIEDVLYSMGTGEDNGRPSGVGVTARLVNNVLREVCLEVAHAQGGGRDLITIRGGSPERSLQLIQRAAGEILEELERRRLLAEDGGEDGQEGGTE